MRFAAWFPRWWCYAECSRDIPDGSAFREQCEHLVLSFGEIRRLRGCRGGGWMPRFAQAEDADDSAALTPRQGG
jgi:hypothetical protein